MARYDGGHFYRRDGTPCYEVPKRGGGMRGINLRWDRELCLVPSVTTVLQVAPKPQLARWKENQMMLAALTLGRLPDESDDAFLRRVREDAFKQVDDAADEGTRIHDACESHYKGRVVPAKYRAVVAAVAAEVATLFPDITDWVSEASFAHPDGFGGKVDLHSPSTGVVIDFKGKDGDFINPDAYGKPKKLGWDQHYQLAAYQSGLELPRAPCANVFFSRTHPVAASYQWSVAEIEEGWAFFRCALDLWRRWRKYDPRFSKVDAAA